MHHRHVAVSTTRYLSRMAITAISNPPGGCSCNLPCHVFLTLWPSIGQQAMHGKQQQSPHSQLLNPQYELSFTCNQTGKHVLISRLP
jgi:hypothetical protein